MSMGTKAYSGTDEFRTADGGKRKLPFVMWLEPEGCYAEMLFYRHGKAVWRWSHEHQGWCLTPWVVIEGRRLFYGQLHDTYLN